MNDLAVFLLGLLALGAGFAIIGTVIEWPEKIIRRFAGWLSYRRRTQQKSPTPPSQWHRGSIHPPRE